jgi:uncharacterized Zn finger protein (UPF0148 family)
MISAEDAESQDSWTIIEVCKACGTPQYRNYTEQYHCYACGHDEYNRLTPGTRLHAYGQLRIEHEGPLTAAMMMWRMEQEGTPIMLKDATTVTHSVSRWRVTRARAALEARHRSMLRIRVNKKEAANS